VVSARRAKAGIRRFGSPETTPPLISQDFRGGTKNGCLSPLEARAARLDTTLKRTA